MLQFQSSRTHPREVSPPSHRVWLEQRQTEAEELQQQFSEWLEYLGTNEALFKRHVYENPEAGQMDFRQHRMRLYGLLHNGENLALRYEALSEPESAAFVAVIEQKLKELQRTLLEWHMPLDFEDSVPESFKEGVKAIDAGRVLDMEHAMSEEPR